MSSVIHSEEGRAADDVAAVMRMARLMLATVVRSAAHVDERLTPRQLRVLVLVADSPTAVTPSAVAAALDLHLSSASRLCDRLVSAGWLDRQESPQDRRNFILSLTGDGSAVLAGVMAYRRQTFTTILEQMTPGDRSTVCDSFDRFADAADDQPSRLDTEIFQTESAMFQTEAAEESNGDDVSPLTTLQRGLNEQHKPVGR